MDLQQIYDRMQTAMQGTPIPPEVAILNGATKDAAASLDDSESTDYRWYLGFAAIAFLAIMVTTTIAKGVTENAAHRIQVESLRQKAENTIVPQQ